MRWSTMVVACAVSLAVLGCGTKKGFEKEGFAYGCPIGPSKVGSMEDLIKSKVSQEGKRTTVGVTELRCTTTGDLLKIEANLNNDASRVQRVAYKFRWIDREGMRAAEEESWKPVLLYERSSSVISAVAPSNKASDFHLIVMGQDQ
ncbi:MAG TPA: DUF1425 domain-containing protein [Burkholderiales bacterium]|nr:DUF1425 domain-containing protein [Burkholderiales bacterium]